MADTSQPAHVYVLLGSGDGTFTSAVPYPAGTFFPLMDTIGDFDGDGRPDLAVGNADGAVYILLGNGNGTFRSGVSFKIAVPQDSPSYIAPADFDSDGVLDLAISSSGGTVSVYLGKGDGTFTLKFIIRQQLLYIFANHHRLQRRR